MKFSISFLCLLSSVMLMTGCGSMYMTKSQTVVKEKKSYSKILVIARGKNEIARSIFEQDVARTLEGHGIDGVAYHKESGIGIPVDSELTEAQIADLKNKVMDMGFDGVILTHLVNAEQYKELIPTGVYPSTDPNYYGQWGYYFVYYPVMDWSPGYSVEGTRLELESALYDVRATDGNSLQWLGRFKLDDPEDLQKATSNYAKELVTALRQESIK
ncbi:MAG: hypothetical protein WBM56_07220 [Robiginitalea sp.]|uniref:hypothetical protein n=1 Tax=Robiginitalea sp. TaxID=1902411 RepID=UPI003C7636D5